MYIRIDQKRVLKMTFMTTKESNICIFFEPFRRRWFLRSLDRLDDKEKLINLFIPFIYSLLITSDTGLVFKYNICVLDRSKY